MSVSWLQLCLAKFEYRINSIYKFRIRIHDCMEYWTNSELNSDWKQSVNGVWKWSGASQQQAAEQEWSSHRAPGITYTEYGASWVGEFAECKQSEDYRNGSERWEAILPPTLLSHDLSQSQLKINKMKIPLNQRTSKFQPSHLYLYLYLYYHTIPSFYFRQRGPYRQHKRNKKTENH